MTTTLLDSQGVAVERYDLASEPKAFAELAVLAGGIVNGLAPLSVKALMLVQRRTSEGRSRASAPSGA